MTGHGGSDHLLISRGFAARVFHAVLFEITAILLTSFFLVVIMGRPFVTMGGLAVIISAIATAWNGIFNFLFDRLQKRWGFQRTAFVRCCHAGTFELGLTLFAVPIVALYLGVDFATAFWLEVGLIVLFLPYSVVFNFIYDKIYVWFYQRDERARRKT